MDFSYHLLKVNRYDQKDETCKGVVRTTAKIFLIAAFTRYLAANPYKWTNNQLYLWLIDVKSGLLNNSSLHFSAIEEDDGPHQEVPDSKLPDI